MTNWRGTASLRTTHTIVSILQTVKQLGYDPQKIVHEFSQIKSLRQTERRLKNNYKELGSRVSRYREVLPLCEQIMRLGIGVPDLIAIHTAVTKKADTDNVPPRTMAYHLMAEIDLIHF